MINRKCKKNIRDSLSFLRGEISCGKPTSSFYCKDHGCEFCGFKNSLETVTNFGKGCCLECKDKAENDYFKRWSEEEKENRKQLVENFKEKEEELIVEIKDIFLPFYNLIQNTKLVLLKEKFIKQDIWLNQFLLLSLSTIDHNSLLTSTEREQWKFFYKSVSRFSDLVILTVKEKDFLISLAQKYKDEQQRRDLEDNLLKCKKCKLLRERPIVLRPDCEDWCKECIQQKEQGEGEEIIKEIKQELNCPAPVNIQELARNYHNYEDLEARELRKIKDNIIEAIKIRRVEKKLFDLLSKSVSCSDDDLWNFIQHLENFTSNHASQYEKNAYLTQQNQVDTMINDLRERWNNLSEETRLNAYKNNACYDFDDWLKQCEDLVLSNHSPFHNFKENVKKARNKEEIDDQKNQAFQHIVEKFKVNIEQELGNEWWENEFQEIKNSRIPSAVKLARDNIKQNRKKSWEVFVEEAINKLEEIINNFQVNPDQFLTADWKNYLRSLESRIEVTEFCTKIEQEIRKTELSKPKQNNFLSNEKKVVGAIIVLVLLILTVLIVLTKRRRKSFGSKSI